MNNAPVLFVNYCNILEDSAHNACLRDLVVNMHVAYRGNPSLTVVSLNCRQSVREADLNDMLNIPADELRHYAVRPVLGDVKTSSVFLRYLLNRRRLSQIISEIRPGIIYWYGETSFFMHVFRKRTQGIRFLFDSRGDFVAEEQARGGNGLQIWWYRLLLRIQLRYVNAVFTVSERLERQYRQLQPQGTFLRMANYYDERHFPARQSVRSAKGPVFIYAGSIKMYHDFAGIIAFIRAYHAFDRNVKLHLVIRNGRNPAVDRLIQELLSGVVSVVDSLGKAETVAYLQQATAGLMLRRKSPINEAAFPTKFAEYLACGLPVISTPCVPDTAKIIEENRLGVLLDPEDPDASEGIEKVRKLLAEPDIHERCAAYARKHLSWDVHRERIAKAILGEE